LRGTIVMKQSHHYRLLHYARNDNINSEIDKLTLIILQ